MFDAIVNQLKALVAEKKKANVLMESQVGELGRIATTFESIAKIITRASDVEHQAEIDALTAKLKTDNDDLAADVAAHQSTQQP